MSGGERRELDDVLANSLLKRVASGSIVEREGVVSMLLKLSSRITECLSRAAEARARAQEAGKESYTADMLDLELHWLRLAESYRFVEQLDRFLEDGRLARMAPLGKLPDTGALIVTCPTTGKEFSTGILTDEATFARLSQELILSHCPHCNTDHAWWTDNAKLVAEWPVNPEATDIGAQDGREKRTRRFPDSASLSRSLGVLVRTAVESTEGEARAAFYVADGGQLHHVVGMPDTYARCVDGFAIGPQSLACGLSAFKGEPIITRDVAEEPLWKPWLWLATQFGYRACWSFPVETPARKVVGTFAMYYQEPREATPRDLDLARTLTRAAAIMMAL